MVNEKHVIKVGPVYYCARMRQHEWLEVHRVFPRNTKVDENKRLLWVYETTPHLIDLLNEQQQVLGTSVVYVADRYNEVYLKEVNK